MNQAPDRALRRRLTLASLGLLLLAVAVSHGLEAALRYPLGDQPLRHGSHGLELAQFAPRSELPRVVLLGNSVYRLYEIAPLMREQAARQGRPLEIINLSQVGSGLDDHVVQAAKALEAQPDLIVCALIDLTFSSYAPRFRTSADTLCFDPSYLRRLPGSFVGRHFGWGETLTGVSHTAIPFARLDPILRHRWTQSPAARPRWLYERLRFPTLNLIADTFDGSLLGFPVDYPSYPPYAHAVDAVAELQAVAGDVPVLWIWQETGDQPPWVPGLIERIRQRVAAAPGARFVDLRDRWARERFRDAVHPLPAERAPYARRHLQTILSALPPRD